MPVPREAIFRDGATEGYGESIVIRSGADGGRPRSGVAGGVSCP